MRFNVDSEVAYVFGWMSKWEEFNAPPDTIYVRRLFLGHRLQCGSACLSGCWTNAVSLLTFEMLHLEYYTHRSHVIGAKESDYSEVERGINIETIKATDMCVGLFAAGHCSRTRISDAVDILCYTDSCCWITLTAADKQLNYCIASKSNTVAPQNLTKTYRCNVYWIRPWWQASVRDMRGMNENMFTHSRLTPNKWWKGKRHWIIPLRAFKCHTVYRWRI